MYLARPQVASVLVSIKLSGDPWYPSSFHEAAAGEGHDEAWAGGLMGIKAEEHDGWHATPEPRVVVHKRHRSPAPKRVLPGLSSDEVMGRVSPANSSGGHGATISGDRPMQVGAWLLAAGERCRTADGW